MLLTYLLLILGVGVIFYGIGHLSIQDVTIIMTTTMTTTITKIVHITSTAINIQISRVYCCFSSLSAVHHRGCGGVHVDGWTFCDR